MSEGRKGKISAESAASATEISGHPTVRCLI